MKTRGKSKSSLLTIPYVARDLEIGEFLFLVKYATTNQIWQKFFRHTSRLVTNQRLKKLVDRGFLRVIPQATVRGAGSLPYIYALGRSGADILSYEKGIPRKLINTTPFSDEAYNLKIKHIIKVTDFLLTISEACALSGYSLSWVSEREIRAQLTKDTMRFVGPDGQQYRTPIPDLLFTLKRGEKSARCWVEIDMGTEDLDFSHWERQSLSGKMLEYITWEGCEDYHRDHGGRPLRLLVCTVGRRRVANMVATAEKVIEQSLAQQPDLTDEQRAAEFVRLSKRFRFITLDAMQPETLLTGPVWTIAGPETLETILE